MPSEPAASTVPAEPPKPPKKPRLTLAETKAREARIVSMRRTRMKWDGIARREGLSLARCHQIYQQALASNPLSAIQVDEHRLEETELIDTAVQSLLGIALSTADGMSARTRVEAWSSLRGWAERKAKLLGLDSPTQMHVVTLDHLDAQIAALQAELEAQPAVNDAQG